ncbi:acyltransferase [Bifidobacterium sp. DSM 109958]|uniref:Acyltransferase n=1 Tax=Bifidobacterium moraviense TaxID=2675323 RepID=A0A7Y0F2G6_9BIFI|nr:acyltransferase [Bifidobacterium sp. DSM 109958]NMN00825.1 acyltransferase [Bifidobacterium sp. DSM 109958]
MIRASHAARPRSENVPAPVPMNGSRLIFADVLNIVSCIAVVALHISVDVFNPRPTQDWINSATMQAFNIFAIPIFFMISGMNLLAYRQKYDTWTFFRKRVWRTGKALLAGSIVCYLIYSSFPQSFYAADRFTTRSVIDFAKRFLTNDINDTYWFFYDIIYLYMLTPILSWLAEKKETLEYVIVVCFVVSVLFPFASWLGLSPKAYSTLFAWHLFTTPVLFFVGGYYIHRFGVFDRVPAWVSALVFLGMGATMAFVSVWSNHYGNLGPDRPYNSYVISAGSLFAVIQAFSLFLFLRALEPLLRRLPNVAKRCIKALSGLSLGVYLYHVLVINWTGMDLRMQYPSMIVRLFVVYGITCLIVAAYRLVFGALKMALGVIRREIGNHA